MALPRPILSPSAASVAVRLGVERTEELCFALLLSGFGSLEFSKLWGSRRDGRSWRNRDSGAAFSEGLANRQRSDAIPSLQGSCVNQAFIDVAGTARSNLPPDLAAIVSACPMLPEHVRACVTM